MPMIGLGSDKKQIRQILHLGTPTCMSQDLDNRQNIFKMISFAYYPNPGTYIYVWRDQILYLAVFGHAFERAKYGQVWCP